LTMPASASARRGLPSTIYRKPLSHRRKLCAAACRPRWGPVGPAPPLPDIAKLAAPDIAFGSNSR
jgi:hypothetical protein